MYTGAAYETTKNFSSANLKTVIRLAIIAEMGSAFAKHFDIKVTGGGFRVRVIVRDSRSAWAGAEMNHRKETWAMEVDRRISAVLGNFDKQYDEMNSARLMTVEFVKV